MKDNLVGRIYYENLSKIKIKGEIFMSFIEQHQNYQRKEKKIGIYKITNLTNNKIYIGKSNDIERRFKEHLSKYEWSRTPNKPLYLAFQKYGVEKFSFDIIEECSIDNLNDREKYWIGYFNSTNADLGYNITEGGDGHSPNEKHPNHKMTKEDVIDIRTRYANLERRKDVEELYKDKIGPSGFKKIWQGITWSNIMPEVYTEENKEFHRKNTGQKGGQNGRSLLTDSDVYEIRLRKKKGEDWQSVYPDYQYRGISKAGFLFMWQGHNWKHIVVD